MKWCVVGANGNMGGKHDMALLKAGYSAVLNVDIGDDIYPGMDGYTVATPINTHYGIIHEIVNIYQPKYIVCEKPCGGSLEESAKIVSMCEANDVTLITSYQRRMDMTLRMLRDRSQDIKVICKMDFEHSCHAFDMRFWYGPRCEIELCEDISTGRALEVTVNHKIIPRALDYALVEFYRNLKITRLNNMCVGKQTLNPHYINEYTSDLWREAGEGKTVSFSGLHRTG